VRTEIEVERNASVEVNALERTRDSGRITASGTIALALDPKRHP